MAGFIGFHAAKALQVKGDTLLGFDNFNDYYDPKLKLTRAKLLGNCLQGDLLDIPFLKKTVAEFAPTHILHVAAQAGVRYSLINPKSYTDSNITGFSNILEIVKDNPQIKLVFASSSSVYGTNKKIPFSEDDPTENQASYYGVTKKCNELMAKTYHHLYGISAIGLRFFTVYGPFGRPDMAYYSFTEKILKGEPITIFGQDQMRDFTYIDDIVSGTVNALDLTGCDIFNLGNHRPVSLMHFISVIEQAVGKKAILNIQGPQKGDVKETYAAIEKAQKHLNFEPKTHLEEGIPKFVEWYKNYILEK